jgi:hypothetical protein
LDERADAEGEVGDGKGGSEGLGVDGEGSLGGAIEGGGEFEEGAGGAEQGEESDEEGGVHDMFAEVFFLAEEAEHEEDGAQVGGDEGGFMDGPGKKKGSQAYGDIEDGEYNGDFWHQKA